MAQCKHLTIRANPLDNPAGQSKYRQTDCALKRSQPNGAAAVAINSTYKQLTGKQVFDSTCYYFNDPAVTVENCPAFEQDS
jgi:hypothetical protein